jgi:hypothetical protein
MKFKMILITALFGLASVAQAQSSMSLSYGQKDMLDNTQAHQVALSVKTRLLKQLDGEVGFSNDSTDATNALTTRMEAGVIFLQPLNENIDFNFKTMIGQKQKSGQEGFAYYSLEPSVKVKLPARFFASVGYRFRNAFDESNNDRSNTMKYAVGYQVTPKDSISLGYDVTRGDGANDMTSIKYTRSF